MKQKLFNLLPEIWLATTCIMLILITCKYHNQIDEVKPITSSTWHVIKKVDPLYYIKH